MTSWHTLLLLTAVAAGAGSLARAEEPFTPPDRELFAQGEFVYERNCRICHGENGDGHGDMSAQLVPPPRSFTQGLFKYRSTPWGKLPSNADLERVIRGGISNTAMGMFTQLSKSEVKAVIEYLKSLSRRWDKPENYAAPVPLPHAPDWFENEAALREHAALGKAQFAAICAACHGTDGDGKGPAAAALKDEWRFPAVPADLRQRHLRSGSELSDVYRVLSTGLNGTPMVSFADTLTPEQRWDLVAYIATLRATASAR
jgi:mono/diheme cytochrome c family protein